MVNLAESPNSTTVTLGVLGSIVATMSLFEEVSVGAIYGIALSSNRTIADKDAVLLQACQCIPA